MNNIFFYNTTKLILEFKIVIIGDILKNDLAFIINHNYKSSNNYYLIVQLILQNFNLILI